jgi:hypothetical protein
LERLNRLFNACFRIQKEASIAAGHHVPMVVENVRGAIPWVGRSRWNFGSFHLWGDVPALMPMTAVRAKRPSHDWNRFKETGEISPHWRVNGQDSVGGRERFAGEGVKHKGSGAIWFDTGPASLPSASPRRKAASAMIAKIPAPLALHIGRVYWPEGSWRRDEGPIS